MPMTGFQTLPLLLVAGVVVLFKQKSAGRQAGGLVGDTGVL